MRCDFHIHSLFSPDSRQTLEEIVAKGKEKGLHVIAVSDHNNIRSIAALDKVDKKGIVFVDSAEYSTDIGHVLALFCAKSAAEWGLVMAKGKYNYKEILAMVEAQQGIAVLAHPFIYKREPSPAQLQEFFAIEGYNARAGYRKKSTANLLAKAAGEALGIPLTAGSDAHRPVEIGGAYIDYDCEPPYTKEKIIAAIKSGGKIAGRPTPPDVMAISQLYKGIKQKNGRLIAKNLLKIPYGWCVRLGAPKDFEKFNQ